MFATEFKNSFISDPSSTFPTITGRRNGRCLDTIEITEAKVDKIIAGLKTNPSPGPDGVHPVLLKNTKSLIGPLTKIMQFSMEEGKLPQQWKESTVIPVYKKGDKFDPNYHNNGKNQQ
ncbi:hypothetical protein QE152_g5756 [Popillia japonica]|uniref:Reverse transcriptase n=1 Tax=Popillia japonica TaxID=7064 RepID=A0AAW1MKI7_POPJA